MMLPADDRFANRVTGAVLGTILFLAAPGGALAHSYTFKSLQIGHVWAPPAQKGGDTEVYGPIFNTGKEPVTLRAVSTDAAAKAGFRIVKDGNATYPDHIDFLPGKPVALASWRQHIWLHDLKADLKKGDTFDLMFDFGKTGSVTVEVVVEKQPSD
jgi:hypothetical protein